MRNTHASTNSLSAFEHKTLFMITMLHRGPCNHLLLIANKIFSHKNANKMAIMIGMLTILIGSLADASLTSIIYVDNFNLILKLASERSHNF